MCQVDVCGHKGYDSEELGFLRHENALHWKQLHLKSCLFFLHCLAFAKGFITTKDLFNETTTCRYCIPVSYWCIKLTPKLDCKEKLW